MKDEIEAKRKHAGISRSHGAPHKPANRRGLRVFFSDWLNRQILGLSIHFAASTCQVRHA